MGNDYRVPVSHGENILYADFSVPKNLTDEFSGFGKIMLDDSLAFYKGNSKLGSVDGSFGVWMKSDLIYEAYGGQSINLTKFWKVMSENGGNVEKAAFETFTGAWAKENGFTRVEYLKKDIGKEKVIIKF